MQFLTLQHEALLVMEEAVMWLLGNFFEYMASEAISRDRVLSLKSSK
jgi:hypothetical protein